MIVTIGGIPVYDAIITDEDTGMMRISLVDDPAVMSNFQAFDSAKPIMMYSIQDEEKRLVRGVVMRADFPIFRRDENLGEYYVIYKADTIRQMAEKYLAESRQNLVNTMHESDSDVDGVQMVQYFIKGDGVSVEGFGDIADGSLFAEYHITNDEVWEQVKAGTYRGFSLEGYFDLVPERNVEEVREIVDDLDGKFSNSINKTTMSKIKKLKALLTSLLQEMGNVTTDRGVLAWDGDEDLKEGDAVFVEDADGNRTPAEDGEWRTEDNKVIVVVDGKVAEIRDAEAEVAPQPEEESKMGRVDTDKGELVWEGEEDLREGMEVFVIREGELVPAEDGEYVTSDNKTIVVTEGRVAELRDPEAEVAPEDTEKEDLRKENEALKAEVESLKAELTELKRTPAAKPAHQEVVSASRSDKTGIKGLDRLSRLVNAGK